MKSIRLLTVTLAALTSALLAQAEALAPELQAKVDARVKTITVWAADAAIVDAVLAHNTALPADQAGLTQEKWKALTVLDPLVRSFSKNPAGAFLKAKKDEIVTEAFLSDAAGLKVAFIGKPTNWSHKGKPKHDEPMAGKIWQGAIEVDESSGQQQIQVAVPVLDGGKPIGALVVGLSITKLSQ